jgi:hypothetical protein
MIGLTESYQTYLAGYQYLYAQPGTRYILVPHNHMKLRDVTSRGIYVVALLGSVFVR